MRKVLEYGEALFWWGIAIVTLVMVWTAQRAVPVMMDDEWYRTLLYSDQAVKSIGDVVKAQIWHYHNWGGRSITHGMLQLILMQGPVFADILNTIALFVLSWLIALVAGQKRNIGFVVMAAGMLHGLNANWKLSMYWQSGACNYLYITILILCFLLCYFRMLEEGQHKRDLMGITFWIIPLGLAAGWSNENMGPTVWIITLVVILWCKKKNLKVKCWMILGNIACLAGSILVIAAPGNFVRADTAASNEYGILWNLFLRGYAESKGMFEFVFAALLLTAIMIFAYMVITGKKLSAKEWLLLLGALLSWGAMVLSPHYPDRASFGTMIFLICCSLSLASGLFKDCPENRHRRMLALVGLIIWLRGMYLLGEYVAVQWGWIL